jgi:hypothetical protein
MKTLPHGLPWALAACAMSLVLVQTARLRWRGWIVGRRLRRQSARAQAGEVRALSLLARRGFRVTARQPSERWSVQRGDEEHTFTLRADYLVERRGLRYVAEVKTGQDAPSLAARATRRQLLEYHCAFAVDGVLLIDAEAGTVDEVSFRLPAARPRPLRPLLIVFVIGLSFGAFATVAVRRWTAIWAVRQRGA